MEIRKVVYFDMDNCLVDFTSGINKLSANDRVLYEGRYDEHPDIFGIMEPVSGAVEAFKELSTYFDCYILSTAPWDNPNAWKQKREWVERYLGESAHKRLILSHHKNLNIGDYLIDDRTKNGAGQFKGDHIHFGTGRFYTWGNVIEYILEEERLI